MPGFSHVLMLRGGRVAATGPRAEVLTSGGLSATFDAKLKLVRTGERYRLVVVRP